MKTAGHTLQYYEWHYWDRSPESQVDAWAGEVNASERNTNHHSSAIPSPIIVKHVQCFAFFSTFFLFITEYVITDMCCCFFTSEQWQLNQQCNKYTACCRHVKPCSYYKLQRKPLNKEKFNQWMKILAHAHTHTIYIYKKINTQLKKKFLSLQIRGHLIYAMNKRIVSSCNVQIQNGTQIQ